MNRCSRRAASRRARRHVARRGGRVPAARDATARRGRLARALRPDGHCRRRRVPRRGTARPPACRTARAAASTRSATARRAASRRSRSHLRRRIAREQIEAREQRRCRRSPRTRRGCRCRSRATRLRRARWMLQVTSCMPVPDARDDADRAAPHGVREAERHAGDDRRAAVRPHHEQALFRAPGA